MMGMRWLPRMGGMCHVPRHDETGGEYRIEYRNGEIHHKHQHILCAIDVKREGGRDEEEVPDHGTQCCCCHNGPNWQHHGHHRYGQQQQQGHGHVADERHQELSDQGRDTHHRNADKVMWHSATPFASIDGEVSHAGESNPSYVKIP
jgi:hypothetical protein